MGLGGLIVGVVLTSLGGEAGAYPAGAAVSRGANPVGAWAGYVERSGSTTVFTAPADQDFVVTDVILIPEFTSLGCRAIARVELTLSTGERVGRYTLGWTASVNGDQFSIPSHVAVQYSSGIPVLAGTSLTMLVTDLETYACLPTWGVNYNLSGYHAQP
jgi:hypothetical protein